MGNNRRQERTRSRKTVGKGMKVPALLRGLLSARRPLEKTVRFCARRLVKCFVPRSSFADTPENFCRRPLLRDLSLHSASSMKAQRRKHKTGPGHSRGYTCPSGTDADENRSSKLVTRSGKSTRYRRRKQQNQVDSSQKLPLPSVSTNQSSEGETLVIDIGINLSSLPPKSVRLPQSVSNNFGSPEASAREKHDRWAQETAHDRHIHPDLKVSPACRDRNLFLDSQNQHVEVDRQREEILSQKETIEILSSTVEELQKTLDKHKQRHGLSGSYAEGSATPPLLSVAFFDTKIAVTRLQNCFAEAIKSKHGHPASAVCLVNPDASVTKYALKADIYEKFFEGFENESFNTFFGVSKFVDPDIRQSKFYEYYLRERGRNYEDVIEDPQYDDFSKMKLSSLWEKLNLTCGPEHKGMLQMTCLEELGGRQLALSFEEAARAVWLLHKLAFSFEPPANIFRVEPGADVDPNYMEPVDESLEDCKEFVPKVGFMIAPGLRHRKSVLRCEICFSCVSTTSA